MEEKHGEDSKEVRILKGLQINSDNSNFDLYLYGMFRQCLL